MSNERVLLAYHIDISYIRIQANTVDSNNVFFHCKYSMQIFFFPKEKNSYQFKIELKQDDRIR